MQYGIINSQTYGTGSSSFVKGWSETKYTVAPKKVSAFDELNKAFGYGSKTGGTIAKQSAADADKIEKMSGQNAAWFESAAADAKASFDQNQQQLKLDRASALDDIKSMYNQVMSIYNTSAIDSNALLGEMRSAIQNTVTGIANAYNNQAAREGERVDALIASGAMGGNAYRAYQAHTQTARDLMSQAVGQIAQVTLSSTESLMNAGIKFSEIDQARSSSAIAAIAALAGTQADIMVNYSKMLTENAVNAQASFQNLMQLNIQQIGQNLNAFISNKKIDADIQSNALNALSSLEQSLIAKNQSSGLTRTTTNYSSAVTGLGW